MSRTALLMVDVQNDFCPGGALAVAGGDEVVEPLNQVVAYGRAHGWLILASRDWHPMITKHFKDYGGIWPVHCVKNTPGAAFHPNLDLTEAVIVSKATQPDEDGYSPFEGHTANGEMLADFLWTECVDTVVIGGLATDYCVKAAALDAVRHGFRAILLTDACRAVNINPTDGPNALKEMKNAGVELKISQEMRS